MGRLRISNTATFSNCIRRTCREKRQAIICVSFNGLFSIWITYKIHKRTLAQICVSFIFPLIFPSSSCSVCFICYFFLLLLLFFARDFYFTIDEFSIIFTWFDYNIRMFYTLENAFMFQFEWLLLYLHRVFNDLVCVLVGFFSDISNKMQLDSVASTIFFFIKLITHTPHSISLIHNFNHFYFIFNFFREFKFLRPLKINSDILHI